MEQYRSYLRFLAEVNLDPRLRARVDASDIVQQTLMQAHVAHSQLRGTSPQELLGWLRRILARNLAHAVRDHRREQRDVDRERSLEQALDASSTRLADWLEADQSSPSQQAQRQERALRVADAIARLPEAQREAVVLHYWRGMSLADIALDLKRTPAAVAGLLHRGLVALRTSLAQLE